MKPVCGTVPRIDEGLAPAILGHPTDRHAGAHQETHRLGGARRLDMGRVVHVRVVVADAFSQVLECSQASDLLHGDDVRRTKNLPDQARQLPQLGRAGVLPQVQQVLGRHRDLSRPLRAHRARQRRGPRPKRQFGRPDLVAAELVTEHACRRERRTRHPGHVRQAELVGIEFKHLGIPVPDGKTRPARILDPGLAEAPRRSRCDVHLCHRVRTEVLIAAGHRSGRDPDAHALVALVLPPATRVRGVWRRSRGVELHRRRQRLVAGVDADRAAGNRRVDPRETEELFDLTGDVNPISDVDWGRTAVKDEDAVRRVGIVVAAGGRSLDEEAAGPDGGDDVVVRAYSRAAMTTRLAAALNLEDLVDRDLPQHRRRDSRRQREADHQPPRLTVPHRRQRLSRRTSRETASPLDFGTSLPFPTRCRSRSPRRQRRSNRP